MLHALLLSHDVNSKIHSCMLPAAKHVLFYHCKSNIFGKHKKWLIQFSQGRSCNILILSFNEKEHFIDAIYIRNVPSLLNLILFVIVSFMAYVSHFCYGTRQGDYKPIVSGMVGNNWC